MTTITNDNCNTSKKKNGERRKKPGKKPRETINCIMRKRKGKGKGEGGGGRGREREGEGEREGEREREDNNNTKITTRRWACWAMVVPVPMFSFTLHRTYMILNTVETNLEVRGKGGEGRREDGGGRMEKGGGWRVDRGGGTYRISETIARTPIGRT